jgi:hypothetical protein
MRKLLTLLSTSLLITVLLNGAAFADNHSGHKLVIQVSTDDPRTQTIALNNAVNLQTLRPGQCGD